MMTRAGERAGEADGSRKRGAQGPDFDSSNIIHQVFENPTTFPGSAEDVFLSWAMFLPAGISAPEAARRVLDVTVYPCPHSLSEAAQSLRVLLEQARDNPSGAAASPGRKNKGRRRKRS